MRHINHGAKKIKRHFDLTANSALRSQEGWPAETGHDSRLLCKMHFQMWHLLVAICTLKEEHLYIFNREISLLIWRWQLCKTPSSFASRGYVSIVSSSSCRLCFPLISLANLSEPRMQSKIQIPRQSQTQPWISHGSWWEAINSSTVASKCLPNPQGTFQLFAVFLISLVTAELRWLSHGAGCVPEPFSELMGKSKNPPHSSFSPITWPNNKIPMNPAHWSGPLGPIAGICWYCYTKQQLEEAEISL